MNALYLSICSEKNTAVAMERTKMYPGFKGTA